LPTPRPTHLPQDNQRLAHLSSSVPPSLPPQDFVSSTEGQPLVLPHWFGRVHGGTEYQPVCIDYASRPRLSSRTYPGGISLPRNPWIYGGGVSHPPLATSYQHSPLDYAPRRLHLTLHSKFRRSPTTTHKCAILSFGSGLLSPVTIVRARPTRHS